MDARVKAACVSDLCAPDMFNLLEGRAQQIEETEQQRNAG